MGPRMGGSVAVLLVAVLVPLLVLPVAVAHRDPTVVVRLTGISPVQPDGVAIDVLDDESTYFVLGNDSDEPVYALDPDGKPYLEVSAAGAFGDLDSRYLRASPKNRASAKVVERPCCTGEGTWVRLTLNPSWIWPDPRLDPILRDDSKDQARGLGALSSEPLANWAVTFRGVDGEFEVSGVVERKRVGKVVTSVTSAPAELQVDIVEARPPQIRIGTGQHEVVVFDRSDRPYLRVSPRGAYGNRSNEDYQANLRALALPEDRGTGWAQVAGSAPGWVTWGEPRLDYRADIPTASSDEQHLVIHRWRIPITIDGRKAEITGQSEWSAVDPPVLDPPVQGPGFWAGDARAYGVAVALTAAIAAAYLAARMRGRRNDAEG